MGAGSGVDFGDAAGRAKTETKRKNEAMLRQVCEDAKGGSLIHASHAIEILSSLRSKSVKQVRVARVAAQRPAHSWSHTVSNLPILRRCPRSVATWR